MTCSFVDFGRGTAVTMKNMLETSFPGINVLLENYPPPLPKRLLRLHLAGGVDFGEAVWREGVGRRCPGGGEVEGVPGGGGQIIWLWGLSLRGCGEGGRCEDEALYRRSLGGGAQRAEDLVDGGGDDDVGIGGEGEV